MPVKRALLDVVKFVYEMREMVVGNLMKQVTLGQFVVKEERDPLEKNSVCFLHC